MAGRDYVELNYDKSADRSGSMWEGEEEERQKRSTTEGKRRQCTGDDENEVYQKVWQRRHLKV